MAHDVWHFFNALRRVVVFVLGVWIIVDGLTESTNVIPKLIVGMIMVGVLPIDNLMLRSPFEVRNKQLIDATRRNEIERKNEAPE